jgi:hypothetical protein
MAQELDPQGAELGQPEVFAPTTSDSELSDEQLEQVAGA